MGALAIIINDAVAIGLGILICKIDPTIVLPRHKRNRYRLPVMAKGSEETKEAIQ